MHVCTRNSVIVGSASPVLNDCFVRAKTFGHNNCYWPHTQWHHTWTHDGRINEYPRQWCLDKRFLCDQIQAHSLLGLYTGLGPATKRHQTSRAT